MTYHLPGRNRSSARNSPYGSAASSASSSVASAAASASSGESMSRASSITASASGSVDSAIASSTASRSMSLPSSSTMCTARCTAGSTESSSCSSDEPSWASSSSDDCSAAVAQSTSSRSYFATSDPFPLSRPGCPVAEYRAGARSARRCPEDVQHKRSEHLVHAPHERHHDDDEHEHHDREAEQLLAGRGDDLPQFGDDLSNEQRHPCERVPTRGAVALRIGDDILAGFVDYFPGHLVHLSWAGNRCRLAGRTGLEPATCGFGDRCST